MNSQMAIVATVEILKKYMLRDVVGEKTKPCSALYSMIKNGV
jgi:hypothetical protein